MAQLVRELMTSDPETLPVDATVQQAAQRMRDRGIGDVLVIEDGRLCGIATDRDIVVRALAEREDLSGTRLGEVCSEQIVTASPNEDADNAIARMREHAIRRIAVVDEGRPVGVLSIGDAAVERDPRSALGDISAARANA
ncbi:CBS domain protein [Prauserella shujinwangii]|uniref:CBS domain protein n=1 Tax=Prauserella shujinwangii TaxID=1453103 RepID=A0A2T0LL51_9PSEU|nr:CBS domain-containing protein [Prauserella shujinwangii]PRX43673.1 CBS domain protein [Prauserella shujinwangii]